MIIRNPVLRGFHPDPSMIYVNGTYYIANSTFEWYPGVCIHKSADLVNWEPVSYPLASERLLEMRGNPMSAGVWAPCLSYSDGVYYLVYSNMRSWSNDPFKDSNNYLITTTDLEGEWSDPVYLNSSGFDASLFHDDDGKKYYLNMEWNHLERDKEQFSGILLQEYDAKQRRLVGEVHKIFLGTDLGRVEGPHIYKKDGWYYLFCAEGGTSYEHAEAVARSRSVFGPYELHPMKHLITSYGSDNINQKTGHASMCCGKDGKWYLAYLSGRPVRDYRCILGRETSIQELVWKEDGWMYLKNGTNTPSDTFEADAVPCERPRAVEYSFRDWKELGDFMTLRRSVSENNFRLHDGRLTVVGKDSPVSVFDQSVLCRRQEHFSFRAETLLEFEPQSFQHMAGLIYRYNEANLYYLFMSCNPRTMQKELRVLYLDDGKYEYSEAVPYPETRVWLRLDVDGADAQFSYSADGQTYHKIGKCADATIMSDEYARPMGFTGAFVGMACQDLRDHRKTADFLKFRYEDKEERK